MNFIRSAINNTRLQYRISKAINDAILDPVGAGVMAECRELAEAVPDMFLQSLATSFLTPTQPEKAFRAMELLESLVQSCSRAFHLALARCHPVQQKLLAIAMRRVDGAHPFQSRAQRLARLTLLEYSRIFMADPDLQQLSTLAALFESRTKRNLLRALNVQNRHIAFTEPRPGDIVLISPRKSLGGHKGPTAFLSSSSDNASGSSVGMPYATLQDFFAARIDKVEPPASLQKQTLPKSMTCPKRWVCPVCQQNNSPMALLCAACETPRLFVEGERAEEVDEETVPAPAPPTASPETSEVGDIDTLEHEILLELEKGIGATMTHDPVCSVPQSNNHTTTTTNTTTTNNNNNAIGTHQQDHCPDEGKNSITRKEGPTATVDGDPTQSKENEQRSEQLGEGVTVPAITQVLP